MMFALTRNFVRTCPWVSRYSRNTIRNHGLHTFLARSYDQKFYHTKIDQKERKFSIVGSSDAEDISSLSSSILLPKSHLSNQISECQPLSKQEQMAQAIFERDDQLAKKLFEEAYRNQDEKFIYHRDDTGKIFLHQAMARGAEEIVNILLASNCFNLDEDRDHQGLTVLHWAIHYGHKVIVQKLLDCGATLITPSKGNKESEKVYPIEMAVAAGRPEIFDLLLQEDTRNQIEFSRSSCLIGNVIHIAIHANQNEMLEHLLTSSKIQNCKEALDPQGRTPLQLAAFLGDCKAIGLLCKKGVHVDKGEGEKGGTAVHYAAIGNQPEAIKTLYYYKANLSALNNNGDIARNLLNDTQGFKAKLCRNLLDNLFKQNRTAMTLPPDFNKRPPYNLVLQGGGPRGIAYVGALKEMKNIGAMNDLRRIAGTSAGAITAALLAVGYTPEEIEKELHALDFTQLLDVGGTREESMLKLGMTSPTKEKAITFALQEYWQEWKKNPLHPIQVAKKLVEDVQNMQGLCTGDQLLNIVEKLLFAKTGIDHLTFGELQKLVDKDPNRYKHLYLIATRIEKGKISSSDCFSSEVFGDATNLWSDLVISDAVRASASIPGVFKPHTLQYKDQNNGVHKRNTSIQFIDGGVLNNYPIEIFDDKKFQEDRYQHGRQTNRGTLGIALEEASEVEEKGFSQTKIEQLRTTSDIAQALVLTYIHAEKIMKKHETSMGRTISIPVRLGLLQSFHATDKDKEEMITSGKDSIQSFFLPKN